MSKSATWKFSGSLGESNVSPPLFLESIFLQENAQVHACQLFTCCNIGEVSMMQRSINFVRKLQLLWPIKIKYVHGFAFGWGKEMTFQILTVQIPLEKYVTLALSLTSADLDLDVPFFLLMKRRNLYPLMSCKIMHALCWAADEGSIFLSHLFLSQQILLDAGGNESYFSALSGFSSVTISCSELWGTLV